MKKILLTLFAVAAVFVACDKDMDESYNIDSISPINAVVDSPEMTAQDAFNFLNNSFKGIDTSVKSVSSSTARTDSSSDWLHVIFSENNGVHVAKLNSEDASETCANGADVSFIYRYAAPVLTIIDAAGAETPFNLSSSLVTRYDGVFGATVDQFVRVNAARNQIASGAVPAISLFDFSCSGGSTSGDDVVGTWIYSVGDENDWNAGVIDGSFDTSVETFGASRSRITTINGDADMDYVAAGYIINSAGNAVLVETKNLRNSAYVGTPAGPAVSSFYTVSCAPFPLTGVLATINSGATLPNGATSANYAGSTEASVRQAIERDILDDPSYTSTTAPTNPCGS